MSGLRPGSGRRPDGAAVVIGVVLAALGTLMIVVGGTVPDTAGGYAGIGPGDVPQLIGWGLVVLAAFTGLSALRGGAPRPRQELAPLVWIVAGLALQLALLKPLGFTIASGLLFACTAAAFGQRNLLVSGAAGFALSLGVYGVFDRLLQLNLPAGLPETWVYGG